MASRYQDFLVELYEEHVEEAAFLIDHRYALLIDEEVAWNDLQDSEARFDAHLDALVIGGEAAQTVASQLASEGDGPEQAVLMHLFSRNNALEDCQAWLADGHLDDPALIKPIAQALAAAAPASWAARLSAAFTALTQAQQAAWLPYLAREHAVPHGFPLADLLNTLDDSALTLLLDSLPGHTLQYNRDTLVALALNASTPRSASAVKQLLNHQLVDPDYFAQHLDHLHPDAFPWVACASRGDFTAILLSRLATTPSATLCLAAGLHGDIRCVPALIPHLGVPELASATAYGLFLLSGAPLYTTVYQEDEIDEDELLPVELANYRQGTKPTNAQGQPFGNEATALSQDPGEWTQWFQDNRQRFQSTQRYRFGKPATARTTLSGLRAPLAYYRLRDWLAFELVVRYAVPLNLDTLAPVPQQQQQIASLDDWINMRQAQLTPGIWYRYGQPCEVPA